MTTIEQAASAVAETLEVRNYLSEKLGEYLAEGGRSPRWRYEQIVGELVESIHTTLLLEAIGYVDAAVDADKQAPAGGFPTIAELGL